MVERPDHKATVLTSQLIRCLSHIDRFKFVFSPEAEELLGDTETGSDIMDWQRLPLAKSLQDRLQVFFWLEFLILELFFAKFHLAWCLGPELLLFVSQILVSIGELTLIIFY